MTSLAPMGVVRKHPIIHLHACEWTSSLHSPTCPSGFRVHSEDSEWIPSTFRASQIKSNVPSGFQAHSEPIPSSCKVMKGSEHTRNGLGMGSESTQKPSEL